MNPKQLEELVRHLAEVVYGRDNAARIIEQFAPQETKEETKEETKIENTPLSVKRG